MQHATGNGFRTKYGMDGGRARYNRGLISLAGKRTSCDIIEAYCTVEAWSSVERMEIPANAEKIVGCRGARVAKKVGKQGWGLVAPKNMQLWLEFHTTPQTNAAGRSSNERLQKEAAFTTADTLIMRVGVRHCPQVSS
jgi:hypothetical protein